MSQADDFYIGYLERAPESVGRFQRLRIAAVIALALIVSGGLMATQSPFSRAQFEFGEVREFTGIVAETPIPSLLVERPGGGRSRYLLATFGKFGAADAVLGLAGKEVRLQGTHELPGAFSTAFFEHIVHGVEPLGGFFFPGGIQTRARYLRVVPADALCHCSTSSAFVSCGRSVPHAAERIVHDNRAVGRGGTFGKWTR